MKKRYRDKIEQWLDGKIQRFSNGLADIRKEGCAGIHYGQLMDRRNITVEDMDEIVAIYAELIGAIETRGEDLAVQLYIPLNYRRTLVKRISSMESLVKKLPARMDPSYYLTRLEMFAGPFPAELHHWPIKAGKFEEICPKAKWFLQQSRRMEEFEDGEEYAMDVVGWWRRE